MTKPKISKSNAAIIEGLEEQRVKQEGIISTLRAEHTQSVIDGTDFDSGPIRIAEDELTAIMDAQQTLVELENEYECLLSDEEAEAA